MKEENELTINAVSIQNLTVAYGETPALAGVSLHVKDEGYLGIIGPNGGGKTTLLKAILRLVPAFTGNITLYGNKAEKCANSLVMRRK